MQGNYVIALAGKTNRTMDRIVAFSIVPMSNVPMLYIFASLAQSGKSMLIV